MTTSLARGPMSEDHYTRLHNDLLRDPRISFKAKGLFGYLASHDPNKWKLTLKNLAEKFPEGISALRSALAELEAFHYLIPARVRLDGGQLGDAVWFYTDLPAQYTQLGITDPDTIRTKVLAEFERWQQQHDMALHSKTRPGSENPKLDKPNLDNQPLKKTKSKKTKTEEHQQELLVSDAPAADTPPKPAPTPSTKRDRNDRDDVKRLCDLLAQEIATTFGEGPPRTYGTKWLDAARLMLDRDGYTEGQIADMIDFAHRRSTFWWQIILSMPNLRDKAQQLKAQIMAERNQGPQQTRTPRNGWRGPYRNDTTRTTTADEYLRRKRGESA